MFFIGLSAVHEIYSTDLYQRLTLESWFTNLEQTPQKRDPNSYLPHTNDYSATSKRTNNRLNFYESSHPITCQLN